jgi:hypothetical protein
MPAEQTPPDSEDRPVAAEETVVVSATESAPVVLPPLDMTPASQTTQSSPAVYLPAALNTETTDAATEAELNPEPVLIAGSPTDAMETETQVSRTWWESGTAMLMVCIGVLVPFSWRRQKPNGSEPVKIGLKRRA